MTSAPVRVHRSQTTLVLLLGASTMATALITGVLFETYEGPGLVGVKTAGVAGLSLLLLAATLTTFVLAARGQPLTRPATIGLVLASSAYPTTFILAAVTLIVLNALGIYW